MNPPSQCYGATWETTVAGGPTVVETTAGGFAFGLVEEVRPEFSGQFKVFQGNSSQKKKKSTLNRHKRTSRNGKVFRLPKPIERSLIAAGATVELHRMPEGRLTLQPRIPLNSAFFRLIPHFSAFPGKEPQPVDRPEMPPLTAPQSQSVAVSSSDVCLALRDAHFAGWQRDGCWLSLAGVL
jgi:hypothetical protein